jgi:hypothetical protein
MSPWLFILIGYGVIALIAYPFIVRNIMRCLAKIDAGWTRGDTWFCLIWPMAGALFWPVFWPATSISSNGGVGWAPFHKMMSDGYDAIQRDAA